MAQLNSTHAIFRYIVPDQREPVEELPFFTTPTALEIKDELLPMTDFRLTTEVVQGSHGLDVQGFTFIKHKSALTPEQLLSSTNVEDLYIQETADLILQITGGDRAFVQNVTFRRKPIEGADSSNIEGVSRELSKSDPLLQSKSLLPTTGVRINGRENGTAWDPARRVHCDFTKKGMLDCMRFSGQDLADAANPILSQLPHADEYKTEQNPVNRPRLAVYSVWRPLYTVKSDPIACLDWRTTDQTELKAMGLRVPSDLNQEKEFVVEQWAATPPKKPQNHRWYWIPDQQPDDVAIIKFADTAESDTVAGGCIHGSPWLPDAVGQPPRQSVEARVFVFWD